MNKSEEEMEQEECEQQEKEILGIMKDNYPLDGFTIDEQPPFKKSDGTIEYRLQVMRRDRGRKIWVPIDQLRAARPKRLDAWKHLLKQVRLAHGVSTRSGSN